ncbi:hypothetical protein F5Y08DRAFT_350257 [Xylaria arbuscula]|nr:hypothetical protein F5Y08DRAFT_350257 [Xylaria arbuscula]
MPDDANLGFATNPAGTSLFIFQIVFLALAWIASIMRAFVKLVLVRKVTIDDYLMLLALLGYTVTAYFVISSVIVAGMGRPGLHSSQDLEIQMRNLLGNMVAAGPVSGLARASIAFFLMRIAVIKWHRIVLYAIISFTAVITVTYFFIVLFQCSPPSYFWEMVKAGASGSCSHPKLVENSTLVWGSLSAAMDWILGLLPIAMLWNVHINRQSKFGIAAILSFGIVGGIALVIRLVYTQQESRPNHKPDIAIGVSAIIELSLGIIAGCIATMPPLLKRMGMDSKSKQSRDSIPWQRSLAGPESIIMMSPRRLERAQTTRYDDRETRRPRPKSPSAKRVLSSSNWDISIEVAGVDDDTLTPPPSRREIQVYKSFQVSSQSLDRSTFVSTPDLTDKPLPPPPPPRATILVNTPN